MEKIRINGSGCLSELIDMAKKGHSAFSKAANGKVYFNFTGWCNSANDDFKDFSMSLNGKQEKKTEDAAIIATGNKGYVANGKIKLGQSEQTGTPVAAAEIESVDDLPF